MKVLINGLPLFASRLAKDLSEADPNSSFTFLDTYNSKWDKLRFFLMVPFCDLVISMNGVSDESGALDWVLKRKKKLVLQWMGTDVSMAIDRMKKGTILRKYIDYASNFVDAPWMIDEVKSLDVEVNHVHFKHLDDVQLIDSYEDISIISYVNGLRPEFYGLKQINELAMDLPQLPIHIYGMDAPKENSYSNIHFHGWCDETTFKDHLRKSAVFLRLTEHDGFSISVLEALASGCEAIWTYPSEFVHHLSSKENLTEKVTTTIEIVKQRENKPNEKVSEQILERFQKSKISIDYLQRLKNCLD